MYYVLDEKGNRKESYSKEEFLSFMQQAIANGDLAGIDADSAFVSKLKCCVGGDTFKIAFVTQAVYNELKETDKLIKNTLYFITDDISCEDLLKQVEEAIKQSKELDEKIGELPMSRVTEDENGVLYKDDKVIKQRKLLWSGSEGVTHLPSTNTSTEKTITFTIPASSTSAKLDVVTNTGNTMRITASGSRADITYPQFFSNAGDYLYQYFANVSLTATTEQLTFTFKQTALKINLNSDTNVTNHRTSSYTSVVISEVYEVIE